MGSVAAMRPDGSHFGRTVCPAFNQLCVELAAAANPVARSSRSPAANGTVIEQQQIITTHNLATLFTGLNLDQHLEADLPGMQCACFTMILDRLGRLPATWTPRLRATKAMAYAWRQMVFILSCADPSTHQPFLAWVVDELAKQPEPLRSAFRPAVRGLSTAIAGRTPPAQGDADTPEGIRFYGWTTGRHWLLERMKADDPAPDTTPRTPTPAT